MVTRSVSRDFSDFPPDGNLAHKYRSISRCIYVIGFVKMCLRRCRHKLSNVIPHQISLGLSNQEDWDGKDIQHVWGTGEVHTGFWCENLRVGDQPERPRRNWEDNIKMDLRDVGWERVDRIDLDKERDRLRVGFCWCGNILSGSIKCLGISWLSEDLLESQEELYSMVWVSNTA
jgi:hypothetical protein